jgi:hypothetical protein
MALAPALLHLVVVMILALLSVRHALLSMRRSMVISSLGATTGTVALLWHKPHSPQHVRTLSVSLSALYPYLSILLAIV